MERRLTLMILAAMLAGIFAGGLCHLWATADQGHAIARYLGIVTDVFLRLIKMIIAPLVFGTLVGGVAHMGDPASLGRIGVRTLAWFLCASLASLVLGLLLVTLLAPGYGMALPSPAPGTGIAQHFDLPGFVAHLVPESAFKAMADNEILQVVVFSVIFGVALNAVGPAAAPILRATDALAAVMLKITGYVMRLAPLAVFAAMCSVVALQGPGILLTYGKFIGGFYLSLVLLWTAILLAGWCVMGAKLHRLVTAMRQPVLLAFSTASSEAAYPRTLAELERIGVSNRIASFVLPLGYSFNLDGSMMYMTFAIMFIVQAYGLELSVAQQVLMLLMLLLTSKGMAGVPRASLVVVAGALGQFGLPAEGLMLIVGVDQLFDMGRSASNVVGNAVAAGALAHWEGEFGEPVDQRSGSSR